MRSGQRMRQEFGFVMYSPGTTQSPLGSCLDGVAGDLAVTRERSE